MRYLAHPDDEPIAVLRDAIAAFAHHLAAHGEARLASVVEGTLTGEADRLPQRFLALFTRGMGGLLDVPLYSDGHLTERRPTSAIDWQTPRINKRGRRSGARTSGSADVPLGNR